MQRRKRHSAPPITSTSPQELPEKHIAAPHSSDYPGNELAVGLVHVPRAISPEQAPEVLCQASPGSVKRNGKRCAGRGVETSHPSFRYHVFVGKDSRTRTSIRNASCSPSAPAWISGEVASRCQEAPHGHVEASLQEQWGGSPADAGTACPVQRQSKLHNLDSRTISIVGRRNKSHQVASRLEHGPVHHHTCFRCRPTSVSSRRRSWQPSVSGNVVHTQSTTRCPRKRVVSHSTRRLEWHSILSAGLNLKVRGSSCQAVSHPSKHVNQPSTAGRRFKWLHLPSPHLPTPSPRPRRISDESRLPSKASSCRSYSKPAGGDGDGCNPPVQRSPESCVPCPIKLINDGKAHKSSSTRDGTVSGLLVRAESDLQ